MRLTIPLVCQTCHATVAPGSIERIEYVTEWGDTDHAEACPCCGDINPGFVREA